MQQEIKSNLKKKVIVFIIVIVAICGVGILLYFNMYKNKKMELSDLQKYVVKIYIDDGTNNTTGSGVIISKNKEKLFICTNAHILNRETIGTITFFNGEEHLYQKELIDEESDIAIASISLSEISEDIINTCKQNIINASGKNKSVVEKTNPGDKMNMITFDGAISSGESLGIVTINEWPNPILETNIDIQPGVSGSPLFDDSGRFMGIAMAKLHIAGYDERYFVVPSSYLIKNVMDNCNIFN